MPATIEFRLDEQSPDPRIRMAVVEIWFGARFVARICSGQTPAGAQEITILTEHGVDVRQKEDGLMRHVVCTIDPTALKGAL